MATLVLAFGRASYEVFWLHTSDPKWGDAWANVSVAVWVLGLTAFVQSALLLLLLSIRVSEPILRRPLAIAACVGSFAAITVWLSPAQSSYPFPTAAVAPVASVLFAHLLVACLASRRTASAASHS